MNVELFAENRRPVEVLGALIARHGVLRVILALPSALLHRHDHGLVDAKLLPDHLQRDIGLLSEAMPKQYWELR